MNSRAKDPLSDRIVWYSRSKIDFFWLFFFTGFATLSALEKQTQSI